MQYNGDAALHALVKESEGPVQHPVNVGTHAQLLEELHVSSKPANTQGKAGL